MDKLSFNNKTKYESERYYSYQGDVLTFTLSETKKLTDEIYLSIQEYNFGELNTAIHLKDLKNTTLDFNGAKLYLKGRIQPFIIENCENVAIKNVEVEYDRAFFTEFEVLGNSADELYVKEKEGFPVKIENGYLIPYSDTWENHDLHIGDMFIQAFDNETRSGVGLDVIVIGDEVKRHESPPCEVHQVKVSEENGVITMKGIKPWGGTKLWDKGTSVIISHETRDKSSCFVINSKNITIENYRILNGAGMGILSMYTENLTINGLKLTKDEKSKGIMTNSADAMHLVSSKGKLIIKNSLVEGMMDDALNIHSNFYQAESVSGNLLKTFRTSQSHGINQYYKVFGIGDRIAIYKGMTLERKAEATITDINIIDQCYADFKLDREVIGIEKGDIIENLSTQPEVLIENCFFGKSNTHLRIQTRGSTLIRNNRTELPIMLTGDTNYWFEASPVNDITLENNQFIGNRAVFRAVPEYVQCQKAPYYHTGIKIYNNKFDNENAAEVRYSDDIEFAGNSHSSGKELKIIAKNCGNIKKG